MTHKEVVSATESMQMLDLIHATLHCQTMERFQDLSTALQNLLGCSQSIFCWKSLGPRCLQGAPKILNVSFPDEFLDILDRDRLWMDNPIAIRGMMQDGLQSWAETFDLMPPSQKLLDIKGSFELLSGYSFSVPGTNPLGVTMLSIGEYDRAEEDRWQFILERLMPHYHLALGKILATAEAEKAEFPSLTGREVEVLSWLKDGKTSWEISVILDISERTINFHVANVKKKLGATNRMNAVAQAMHLGLVC